ncbi:MAG: amphi-Trp domain-containing protein [Thiomicrospira sp.]|jgi:amphi-Trp domain-containing protein|nr:amphi-Trp domain-containing protein [Thiomicrospira sp.]
MAKNTHTFEHESLQDKEAILHYLRTLMDGFDKGEIHLANEDDDVLLTPQGLARLKIKAKQAKSHQEIRLTLAWNADLSLNDEREPTLHIASAQSKKPKKKSKA